MPTSAFAWLLSSCGEVRLAERMRYCGMRVPAVRRTNREHPTSAFAPVVSYTGEVSVNERFRDFAVTRCHAP